MPLAETQILQGPIASLTPALVLFGCLMRHKGLTLLSRIDRQSRGCEKASNALLCR
jgi:hypothetical protein